MRVVRTKPFVRKRHKASGLLFEKDLVMPHGDLRAKLLIFAAQRNLRDFWKKHVNGKDPGPCLGCVSGLYAEMIPDEGRNYLAVDPSYFACIGLIRKHLTTDVIAHEAVHAAFAFTKRQSRSPWDVYAKQHDEEAICYPTGWLAGNIAEFISSSGLALRHQQ